MLKIMWKVPKDLGPYGRELWKNAGRELIKSGSLLEMDKEAFLTMCLCYERMMQSDHEMQRDGLQVESGTGPGIMKKHPAFAIWKTSLDAYMKLLSHFGLSPQARGVKVSPKEEVNNEKDKFFS